MSVSLYGSGQTVLQVVQGTYSSQVSTTSSSFVSAGLSATITPQSTNSKILIFCYSAIAVIGTGGADYQIQRGGTVVAGTTAGKQLLYIGSGIELNCPLFLTALDSPSSTSALTYTLYLNSNQGNSAYAQSNNTSGYIELLEISGS
jgi:hypothetical protein